MNLDLGLGVEFIRFGGCLVRLRVIVARGVNSFFNTEGPSRFAMIHTYLLLDSTVTVERTLRAPT